ncbi:MAG TPA: ATPase [Firmicutes bacterium]|nr:ATPase [Bacillota bacterium]
MDVAGLIKKLEDLIENSSRIPLTGKVILDEEGVYEILDEIEATLPDELKQAKIIAKERDRILEEAKQEAEKIISKAREEVGKLVDESTINQQAMAKAEEIVANAQKISKEIRAGALEFADEVLAKSEEQVSAILKTIREARSQLARDGSRQAQQKEMEPK